MARREGLGEKEIFGGKAATVAFRMTEIIGKELCSSVDAFEEDIKKRIRARGGMTEPYFFYEDFEKLILEIFPGFHKIKKGEAVPGISLAYKFLNPELAKKGRELFLPGKHLDFSGPTVFNHETFSKISKKVEEGLTPREALASIIREEMDILINWEKKKSGRTEISSQTHFGFFQRVREKIVNRPKDHGRKDGYPSREDVLLYMMYYPQNYLELFSPSKK